MKSPLAPKALFLVDLAPLAGLRRVGTAQRRREPPAGWTSAVNGFARIIPFLWPSRKKLLVSFVFAALVAVLWGGNLSIAFPVVKVLVEGQNAAEYVRAQIEECEKVIENGHKDLAKYELDLSEPHDQDEEISYTRKKSRAEASLTKALQR